MGLLRQTIREKGHADQQRYCLAIAAVKKEGNNLEILELGSDDGSFAYGFALLGNKVTAIDLDFTNAERIHPHINITYIEDDVKNINYCSKFDIVRAGEILERVKNPRKLMKLICRSVKKNGLIMISVPNFKHPEHLRTYTLRKFKKLLKKHNINGTIRIIKHNLARKSNKTERYAIYDGRLKQ